MDISKEFHIQDWPKKSENKNVHDIGIQNSMNEEMSGGSVKV